MPIPSLNETTIRRQATRQSFARGEDYYQEGAVISLAQRGNTLHAEVEGSEDTPYQVTVHCDAGGITSADCTCPYDYGGWCKHIVATLLTCLHEPGTVEERPPLPVLLAGADRGQLLQLLLNLTLVDPGFIGRIESEWAELQADATPSASATAPTPGRTTVDPRFFRRQVQAALHSLDRRGGSEAYERTGAVVGEIRHLLNPVQEFLEAGDGRSALAILEAITDEYVEGWTDLDDSDGDAGALFNDLGPVWTEALLTADLSPAERRQWDEKLMAWENSVSDYGVDEAFGAARHAAQTGWDDPYLQRMLRGEITEPEPGDAAPPVFADELAAARLTVLDRRERYDEFLRLAQAEGRWGVYAMQLAYLGRTAEAVAAGLAHLKNAGEALQLAAILRDRGEPPVALQVAEHGLTLAGSKAELAAWLSQLAAGLGNSTLAVQAAVVACKETPNLSAYRRVQELAGADWPTRQAELLAHLRQSNHFDLHGRIDIFLHESLIDDAIAAVEQHYAGHELVARVAKAAIAQRPDWVIRTARSRAESIMNDGKAAYYYDAVEWLKKARAAYEVVDRRPEWLSYLNDLRVLHQRKHKLRPMLERL